MSGDVRTTAQRDEMDVRRSRSSCMHMFSVFVCVCLFFMR